MAITERSWFFFLTGVCLFLGSRWFIWDGDPPHKDVLVFYLTFVREAEWAARHHRSVYDVHRQAAQQRQEALAARGQAQGRNSSGEEYLNIEYPPLALAFLRLPVWWMSPEAVQMLQSPSSARKYYRNFRLTLLLVDVVMFVCLLALLSDDSTAPHWPGRWVRMIAYLGSTLALRDLMYERMDLVQAVLVMLAFWALLRHIPYFLSAGLLALAVNFKLVPIILAPVWLAGTLPPGPWTQQTLRTLVGRGVVLAGLIVLVFLPFYFSDGPATLAFFDYHRDRGIELGSVYASFLLLPEWWGRPVPLQVAHASLSVVAPLAPTLKALAPLLTALLFLGAVGLLVYTCWRLPSSAKDDRTLAGRQPEVFAGHVLLLLLLFVISNKVLSPQYMIWLAPFVALAPLRGASLHAFLVAFAAACVLTALSLRWLTPDVLMEMHVASLRYLAVLTGRNLLLIALAVWLAWDLGCRSTGAAPLPAREQPS